MFAPGWHALVKRKHADNAFVLVDCITPQMGACLLHRLCDGFVVSFGEAC
jgi:hypothetical protein